MMERDVADHADMQRALRVVRDDPDHVHRQLADAVAVEQVAEAMVELRHQQQHALALLRAAQRPFGIDRGGERRERAAQRFHIALDLENDAHEEAAGEPVVELLRVGDVAASAGEETGDLRDQTGPVGAGEAKRQRLNHGLALHKP